MSHDLHVNALPGTEHLFGKCHNCGKPMERSKMHRYGSNACKQAAYRKRLTEFMRAHGKLDNRTQFGPPAKGRQKQTPPPLVGKTLQSVDVAGGHRFRGKQKGGAA